MAPENVVARPLAKQFAVGFGIAVLLPLAVWSGVNLYHPAPDRMAHSFTEIGQSLQAETGKDAAEKEKLREEQARRKQEFDDQERRYYRDLFFAAYPAGLLALVGGALLRVQAVGAGLMFGGLFTLGEGCYSYWDKMGDALRFGSLLGALALVVALGCWRARSGDAASDAT